VAAVEGGIVSRYVVRDGTPAEDAQLPPSREQHLRLFTRLPRLLTAARGVHAAANARYATAPGVTPGVWPKPGAQPGQRLADEPQRGFRRGRAWRAGLEGRLSGVKRRHQLERGRYHGPAGRERWVGWGGIAHTLRGIAQATAASPARQAPQVGATSLSGQRLTRHKRSQGCCTSI
jgi:IS5 family transposase